MCLKFADPLEACRAVVAESYELWLQYELRTDDITMIAIFIDEASAASAPTAISDIVLEGVRPVRRTLSKQKKDAMMKARSSKEDADFDIQQYVTPKTEHEKVSTSICGVSTTKVSNAINAISPLNSPYSSQARIAEAIKASFLFQHISPANRELLFSVMEKVRVQKGDWVIRQGDEGDRFYIVDNGKFEVRIQSEEKVRRYVLILFGANSGAVSNTTNAVPYSTRFACRRSRWGTTRTAGSWCTRTRAGRATPGESAFWVQGWTAPKIPFLML